MKKSSKGKLVNSATYPNGSTIGLDVSDDYIYAAVIDGNGTLLIEDRIRTREPDVRRCWRRARSRGWLWKPGRIPDGSRKLPGSVVMKCSWQTRGRCR